MVKNFSNYQLQFGISLRYVRFRLTPDQSSLPSVLAGRGGGYRITVVIISMYSYRFMMSWTPDQSSLLSLLLDEVVGTQEIIDIRQDYCSNYQY